MANTAQEQAESRRLREDYERLMDAASRNPGVSEVLQVYGRLAPYAPAPVAMQRSTRYAAGGNA